jgi:hypothetical protein
VTVDGLKVGLLRSGVRRTAMGLSWDGYAPRVLLDSYRHLSRRRERVRKDRLMHFLAVLGLILPLIVGVLDVLNRAIDLKRKVRPNKRSIV